MKDKYLGIYTYIRIHLKTKCLPNNFNDVNKILWYFFFVILIIISEFVILEHGLIKIRFI